MAKSAPNPVPIVKSVLIDTGFLITVFDDQRPNHLTALSMYQFFIEHAFTMYLSSIVVSEFCVRGDIQQLPLSNFLPLTFDFYDGTLTGKINFTNFLAQGDDRTSVKDDIKLVAQMVKNGISYFATEDGPLVRKLATHFPDIIPILATESVTQHFSVHRINGNVVVSRGVPVGQTVLF